MCDAITAVVKCSTKRESLRIGQQREITVIATPLQMFQFCERQLTSATLCFAYVPKTDVMALKPGLATRYKDYKTIQGTLKHHVFIPRPEGIMAMGRTSDAELLTEVELCRR